MLAYSPILNRAIGNISGGATVRGAVINGGDPMADAKHESLIITGLKNAHAMENQALSIMKPQVSRIENYPAVARRLEQHITETEGQITRLESLLDGFDTD